MKRLIFHYALPLVLTGAMAWSGPEARAESESFESLPSGALTANSLRFGALKANPGHAEIWGRTARTGKQSLRLLGGKDRTLELKFRAPLKKEAELSFWAERWTRQNPFAFKVDARARDGWKTIYQGDKAVQVGGFEAQVKVMLPRGTQQLRFVSTTPAGSGVLIDDFDIQPVRPMQVLGGKTVQPLIPTMVRMKQNPVMAVVLEAQGSLKPKTVKAIRVSTAGTSRLEDVKAVRLYYTGSSSQLGKGVLFGEAKDPAETLTFQGEQVLTPGLNHFWVAYEMKMGADLLGRVDAGVSDVMLGSGQVIKLETPSPEGSQRIGYAVTRPGDGNSLTFRIPGLATTNKGTLIGVYDMRYNHGHDLPGDIDVGMSRSVDGGQNWDELKIIMNMGNEKKWHYDGIGDPAVLVDRSNNRIWVAATWSHGNRSWRGSGKGMTPEETGQFMLVYSDDEGATWSEPINITKQVKKPEWHFILQGPGKGITMKDGTLVFPAQYQDETKQRMPYSTLIYSKDHGKTWHCGTGVKSNTTEAQLVELADGSIMINCRDNRGGSRTVATTADLGKTWKMHPTDRKALNEPVCMASLIRTEHKELGSLLLFSNPNTPRPGKKRGRYDMSFKVSDDEGMSWPEKWHTLYDSRPCAGYSCMTMVDEDHVGVLYEGVGKQMFFLKVPLKELKR